LLKMFTTQLIGRLKMIEEKEVYNLEDAARLLAQALVGEGNIFIYTEPQMEGILAEALNGPQPLEKVEKLNDANLGSLTSADRVILFLQNLNSNAGLKLAETLYHKGIPFAACGSLGRKDENRMEEWAYVTINLHTDQGLVPTDTGRAGFVHQLAALYVYHGIKLFLDEMMEDL